MPKKLLIVGGGPAGAACALEAVRNGWEIDLFEKGTHTRDKICGDALLPDTLKNLAYLQLLPEVQAQAQFVPQLVLRGPRKSAAVIPIAFWTLQRRDLDRIFRQSAERIGVSLHEETEIVDVEMGRTGVRLCDRRGNSYHGDFLVLATGANARLLERAGFPVEPYSGAALRAYFSNPRGVSDSYLWVDRRLGSGYAWIFPCPGGFLNVGLGTAFRNGHSRENLPPLFKIFFQEMAGDLLVQSEQVSPLLGFPLRAGLQKKKVYGKRVLLVGEAAHCTYYLTGDGIGPALSSGILAARALAALDDFENETGLAGYQENLNRELGEFHKNFRRAWRFFKNPVGFYLFATLIRYSRKVGATTAKILSMETTAEKLFSFRGFLHNIF